MLLVRTVAVTVGILLSSSVFADESVTDSVHSYANWGEHAQYRLDSRGDRIDNRLNIKGDRINKRLDARSDLASMHGNELLAKRLDVKGNRIERHLDLRGDRINTRMDVQAKRIQHRVETAHTR